MTKFLWGHSVRQGLLGKLAGIAYRVCESVKEILWGRSDRIAAREAIEDMLVQIQKLQSNTYKAGMADVLAINERVAVPKATRETAEKILHNLLTDYNRYATL